MLKKIVVDVTKSIDTLAYVTSLHIKVNQKKADRS